MLDSYVVLAIGRKKKLQKKRKKVAKKFGD